MSKPVYVLGTGLSHDGSSCLLKDGKIIVAIEKERLSRVKHDGGNDFLTTQYCLNAAGITIYDISLVVQAANFEKEEIKKHYYKGKRYFDENCQVPFVSISHQLAHAYSAIGNSPFDECCVLVIDGCGSFYHQCDDIANAFIPSHVNVEPGLYAEKDSYYHFKDQQLTPLYKDFSIINFNHLPTQTYLPTTRHSIGGLYAMTSYYCFGDMNDAGKLMGLAPYGEQNFYQENLLVIKDGNVFVNEPAIHKYFTKPANPVSSPFKEHFNYYANIARWVQEETEKAVIAIMKHRLSVQHHPNICYAGGVALNAVANTKILEQTEIKNLYIEQAAADNGLAIGCAYYGWLQVLKGEKRKNNNESLFGKVYTAEKITSALSAVGKSIDYRVEPDIYKVAAENLSIGKTIGWFQSGAEFGPRALGRRSILADPRNAHIQRHINSNIKFREDFRPFAPSVLFEDRNEYFQLGLESPYMILIDRIKEEWRERMPGIVHVDGTCRVQTVKDENEPFYKLLQEWKRVTGISVLLNTSFNRKGMPIVETPGEAIDFFLSCQLDILIINNYIITKND